MAQQFEKKQLKKKSENLSDWYTDIILIVPLLFLFEMTLFITRFEKPIHLRKGGELIGV